MKPVPSLGLLSPWEPGILALIVFSIAVVGMMAVLMVLTSRVGEKRPSPEKSRPYESGIIPTGSARLRYPVPFFLVAIFFLIFDVEGAFIFSWATACDALGMAGWLRMTFFILVLIAGLVYIWLKGGLNWGIMERDE